MGDRLRWAVVAWGMAALPAFAAGDLPEGTVPERVLLGLIGRGALLLVGLFLCAAGRRFERCTYGTLFLLLGFGAGWTLLADVHYLLALLAAFALYAALALVQTALPRVASALATALLFPSLYGALLLLRGDFRSSGLLASALALAGLALGALAPRFATSLLAPCVGAVLIVLALPVSPTLAWVPLLVGAGFLWQVLIFPLVFPYTKFFLLPAQESAARRRAFLRYLGVGGGTLAAGVLLTVLLIPQPPAAAGPHGGRLAALRKGGGLARPSILLSEDDALYLFGAPLSLSLLSEREGLSARLDLLLRGRSPSPGIDRLRSVKEPGEVEAIRKACEITSRAFEDVAPLIRPGANEAELERAVLDSFRRHGASGVAFRAVVGSGANATLPHYDRNDAPLKEGFLVLDIGCSYGGYAGDMTRTFPVTGRYTPAQKELIEAVERAHQAARKVLKPGSSMERAEAEARKVLDAAGFGDYFTHGIGHGVGLNVHDPGGSPLRAGMVVTVEPGLYIPRGEAVDEEYWDLGVRIEDTYLITADGSEALTHYPHIPGGDRGSPGAAPR